MTRLTLLLLVAVAVSAEAAPAPFPRARLRTPDRYWRIDFSPLTGKSPPLGRIILKIGTEGNGGLVMSADLSHLKTTDEVVAGLKRTLADGCSISMDGVSLKIWTYKGRAITSIKVWSSGSTAPSTPRIIKPLPE
jgi:hypothetical protein